MRFEVYTKDVADLDFQTKQGLQLVKNKGGEVSIKEAPLISERRLKQAVGFPRFFYGDKHIGNLKSLKKFMATWRPDKMSSKFQDVPAREVSKSELQKAWRTLKCGIFLTFLDKKYWVANEENVQRVIQGSQVNRVKYRSDRVDCDNFSIRFAADANSYGLNTVAIVYDIPGKHCYNVIFVDTPEGIVAKPFEPQTDKYVQMGHSHYTGRLGVAVVA